MNSRPLCLVAGKSGGHILPCLQLVQKYQPNFKQKSCIFFATTAPLDYRILHGNQNIQQLIQLPFGTNNYTTSPFRLLLLMIEFIRSFFISFWYLLRIRPFRIVSTGGSIALPVCITAWILRIPIDVYELNAKPGKAMRVIAHLATTIYTCFSDTAIYFPKQKTSCIPYPIRFSEQERCISQTEAQIKFGFSQDKKTIFIIGGSQGSQFLNTLVGNWLSQEASPYTNIQIIHQTGNSDHSYWQKLYESYAIPAYVFTYTDAIAHCYTAADLIICRAGAGTLFEVIFFNKQCITIPLETNYTAHQYDNAHALAQLYPENITIIRQTILGMQPSLFSQAITLLLKLNC